MSDTEYRISPDRLRLRRTGNALSRGHLAAKIGMCDPAYLYQMERVPKNCGVDLATRLALALGCEISDLTEEYTKGKDNGR